MYRPRARDKPVHSGDHGVDIIVNVYFNSAAAERLAAVPIKRDFRRGYVRNTSKERGELLLGRLIRQVSKRTASPLSAYRHVPSFVPPAIEFRTATACDRDASARERKSRHPAGVLGAAINARGQSASAQFSCSAGGTSTVHR